MAMSTSIHAQDTRGQSGAAGSSAQRPADTTSAGRSDSRGFVNDLAIAGMAEVELGRMAADRAANADVKAFGQMMVRDHSKANDELKQVASQLNIQPTTQLDQKHRALSDKLSTLKGAEFDREYMTAMVQGHEDVLAKLRERTGARSSAATQGHGAGSTAGGTGEQALTQWAAKAMPTVQQHLERAQQLQQQVGK
jgi:putative membrane protein